MYRFSEWELVVWLAMAHFISFMACSIDNKDDEPATNSNPEAFQCKPAVAVSADNLVARSGASPRQLTNKGFASVAYNWSENQYAPYLAVVGEVEAGSRNSDLSLWGVHLKGGMSY